jgi:hypothetical protein
LLDVVGELDWAVPLSPDGTCTDEDDIGERSQGPEHRPVRWPADIPGAPADGDGAVKRGNRIDPDEGPAVGLSHVMRVHLGEIDRLGGDRQQ